MSNIVRLKLPQHVIADSANELGELVQNSELPGLLKEFDAKLRVMLDYAATFRALSDAALERQDVS